MPNVVLKTEIENLLQKFYAGEATPEQIRRIAAIFRETDMSELDASMRADKLLFEQMERLRHEPVVPQGLETRLSAAIDADERRSKFRASGSRLRIWVAAAIAAVVVTVGVAISLREDRLEVNPGMTANAVQAESAQTVMPQTPINDEPEMLPSTSIEETAVAHKTHIQTPAKKSVKEESSEEGTIIIILDKEESDRISEEVLRMLQANLSNTMAMLRRDKGAPKPDNNENTETVKEEQ